MKIAFAAHSKQIRIERFHLFIGAMIVVKLFFMALFSSDYQECLFMPFATWFVRHGQNPYDAFMELGVTNAFPYPPVMLFMESIGAVIVQVFKISSTVLTNFVFKLPNLFLDLLGLYFLTKLFPIKRRYAAVIWFASPIIQYAVYMHGQLDLIPTVFLLGSVYYISSKVKYRNAKGALFMVLALLSKLHVLAVLPLVLMYIYKRDGFKRAAIFAGSCFAGTFAGILPFLSHGLIQMVFFNKEQSALTDIALQFGSVEVYVAVAAVFVLYLSAFRINFMNRDLLLSMYGMVFAIFLVLCPSMPGWYVWVIPYITFFFMDVDKERYQNIAVYMFLNVLYILYFALFHNPEGSSLKYLYFAGRDLTYLKISGELYKNVIFTLLTGTLVYIVCSMYRLGISSNSVYKRRNIPFTIGIAGDSGTGKSMFLELAKHALGNENILFIEGDGDHRWEREDLQWKEFTHLNPKANYLYRQAQDLRELRSGNAVRRVEYDHNTGRFTDAKKIKPKNYVILCGLHAMYLPQTRKHLDLKIYMDVDETLRRYWKMKRDMKHRGYSKESILFQMEERMPDAMKYIYPQKNYADIIVHYYDKTLSDCMDQNHEVKLSCCITVSAAIDLESLVDELSFYGIVVRHDYSDDLSSQVIEADAKELFGQLLPAENLAQILIPQLDDITKENMMTNNDLETVISLILLMCISRKMRGEF